MDQEKAFWKLKLNLPVMGRLTSKLIASPKKGRRLRAADRANPVTVDAETRKMDAADPNGAPHRDSRWGLLGKSLRIFKAGFVDFQTLDFRVEGL